MTKKNGHPSGDERFKAIDLTMKRFKYEKDALLEVLNTAQENFGYLSEDLIIYISTQLGVPMSQIYGVATFYHLFTFEPLGEHNCIVCTGTACHVKGSDKGVGLASLSTICRVEVLVPWYMGPGKIMNLKTPGCSIGLPVSQ